MAMIHDRMMSFHARTRNNVSKITEGIACEFPVILPTRWKLVVWIVQKTMDAMTHDDPFAYAFGDAGIRWVRSRSRSPDCHRVDLFATERRIDDYAAFVVFIRWRSDEI